MKVTYDWLKMYVDIPVDYKKLSDDMLEKGIPVESVEKIDDDYVYEIEVPPNRPDLLSVIGIAREVAAIYGLTVKIPTAKDIRGEKTNLKIDIKTEDCSFYSGRIIRNIEIKDSPTWMKNFLERCGIRSINNVVDITNFVMMETGNPLHAFDLRYVKGETIIVDSSKEGETFDALDEKTYKLPEGTVLIKDTERVLAMGGIIGGKESEIKDDTKDILIEAAFFNPIRIRKTCRNIGISTDSSYRFERTVDITTVRYASHRCLSLLLEDNPSAIIEEMIVSGKDEKEPVIIDMNYEKVRGRLGLDISDNDINDILKKLGFTIENGRIFVPDYRRDIFIIEDISEEIARYYGYSNIPSNYYQTVSIGKIEDRFRFVGNIKRELSSMGLNEIIVPTFASYREYEKFGYEMANVFKLMNPLSSEMDILRPEVGVSLLHVCDINRRRYNESVAIFEVNSVFTKEKEDAIQVGILFNGRTHNYDLWNYKREKYTFYHIKGVLENLFDYLRANFTLTNAKYFLFEDGWSFGIYSGDVLLGYTGMVSKRVKKNFEIKGDVFIALMDIDTLMSVATLKNEYEKIPHYPHLKRDIAFIVKDTVPAGDMEKKLKEIGGDILYNIYVFDVYKGKPLKDDEKNVAFHLDFNGIEKTLSDDEINDIIRKMINVIESEFDAKLRDE